MVCDFGMSERVRALPMGHDSQSQWQLLSDETVRLIDSEVSRLVSAPNPVTQVAGRMLRCYIRRAGAGGRPALNERKPREESCTSSLAAADAAAGHL